MKIADQVLWAVLAGMSGAVGGIWTRRSLSGAVPGALLAWTWSYAIAYPRMTWRLPDFWASVLAPLALLVIGFMSSRFAGRGRGKLIDLPLDGRLGYALFSGFFVRGVFALLLNLPECRRILPWLTTLLQSR